MAATSGLSSVTGRNVAGDILTHLFPATRTVATAITGTGPIKGALQTALVNNDSAATAHECTDANYARQSITGWGAVAVTSGQGYGAGFSKIASTVALTYGGAGGFAVGQTFTGVVLASSDATPVEVAYQNFAASVSVLANQQYVVASGSCTVEL